MDRDKVTRMLKMYPSYKYAVRMYEQSRGVPCASTAIYDDMPRSSSFGPRAPRMNDGISLEDVMDYQSYKRAVEAVDGAMETLTEEERYIVRLKWIDGLTFVQMEMRGGYAYSTIKLIHKRALKKLAVCLRFNDIPELEQITETLAIS